MKKRKQKSKDDIASLMQETADLLRANAERMADIEKLLARVVKKLAGG